VMAALRALSAALPRCRLTARCGARGLSSGKDCASAGSCCPLTREAEESPWGPGGPHGGPDGPHRGTWRPHGGPQVRMGEPNGPHCGTGGTDRGT
jgi:hypothetical protein